jgi:hypothetical protein
MPADAKLVWITPAHSMALMVAISRCEQDGFENVAFVVRDLHTSVNAAPEPVERRRCVTHGEEQATWSDGTAMYPLACWHVHHRAPTAQNKPCRFETVYEVPAPSQPEPPDEATT